MNKEYTAVTQQTGQLVDWLDWRNSRS